MTYIYIYLFNMSTIII